MNYRKNDVVEVTIEDLGTDGEGIGRIDGYTLFVKDALIGDRVEAGLTKVKKNYAYARLVRVIEPSKDRISPVCPVHKQCGGCQIQAMSYEAQLQFKQNKVRNNLIRLGGISPDYLSEIMEPIAGMPDGIGLHYRNKAQFPIGYDKDGHIIAGFYAGRTHSIIACEDCALGPKEYEQILKTVISHMETYEIRPYQEETGEGLVRHVMIRKGFASGQIMVCVVINGEELLQAELLADALFAIPGMTSFYLNVQTERTNVIMGTRNILIRGRDTIEDTIHLRDAANDMALTDQSVRFEISPLSFYQVNPVQTERMYSQALYYADLTGNETVWDLYCGIGTISLFLARRAGRVCGVEIVEPAILNARENALRNGIKNATFFVGAAEEVLPAYAGGNQSLGLLEGDQFLHPDVIVVDPPRKGCDEKCLETMAAMAPEKIVYVSCDSATLARDVKYLSEHGYQLKKVRAFDNFPQTVHVETVVLLSKKHVNQKECVEMGVDAEEYYKIKGDKHWSNEKLNSTCTLKNGLYDDFEE